MDEQNIKYGTPIDYGLFSVPVSSNRYGDAKIFSNGLGLGLGNINTTSAMRQNNNMQQTVGSTVPENIPRNNSQAIVPLLDYGQQIGASASFNVSPDLAYLKYSGQIAGQQGDITGSLRGSRDQMSGTAYTGQEYGATLQYQPSQIKGLMMQADMQKNTNSFGLDANKTSGGISYAGDNWGAALSGSRSSDNYGSEDKNISANVNYRW